MTPLGEQARDKIEQVLRDQPPQCIQYRRPVLPLFPFVSLEIVSGDGMGFPRNAGNRKQHCHRRWGDDGKTPTTSEELTTCFAAIRTIWCLISELRSIVSGSGRLIHNGASSGD
jgi:hypothetical protein